MSEAALLAEIERLSGAIDRHKTRPPYAPRFHQGRNQYVNPTYPNRKYVNPAVTNQRHASPAITATSSIPGASAGSNASRELVVDDRVAYTKRKLTRQDLTFSKADSVDADCTPSSVTSRPYVRKRGTLIAANRVHKPKFPKRKILAGRNNMVLDNVKGTRTGNMPKRRKIEKQCRFFTITGICQRGLTCPYQHDPEKIAICPQFLTHTCPNTAETCQLSHDPTPARVPLCHHFQNHGRCTRDNCPYPHVRIGSRDGICRDFAVLGYCDKGIDCGQQHVRECPDFAEKGTCPNRGCKLPHVIRANKKRQSKTAVETQVSMFNVQAQLGTAKEVDDITSSGWPSASLSESTETGAAEEYIALTFEESEEEESEEEDESDEVGESGEGEVNEE